MNLAGQTVKLRLSSRGVTVLKGLVKGRTGAKRSLQAFVLSNDSEGLWIDNGWSVGGEIEVLLVKWEYVEAVGFERGLPEPIESRSIGFHR